MEKIITGLIIFGVALVQLLIWQHGYRRGRRDLQNYYDQQEARHQAKQFRYNDQFESGT